MRKEVEDVVGVRLGSRVGVGGEPVDSFVGAEPGELAFGEAAGVLFHGFGGLFEGAFAVEVGDEFAVAERTEAFEVGFVASLEQGGDFADEAGFEDVVDAGIDAVVEDFAWPGEGDLEGGG